MAFSIKKKISILGMFSLSLLLGFKVLSKELFIFPVFFFIEEFIYFSTKYFTDAFSKRVKYFKGFFNLWNSRIEGELPKNWDTKCIVNVYAEVQICLLAKKLNSLFFPFYRTSLLFILQISQFLFKLLSHSHSWESTVDLTRVLFTTLCTHNS